MLRLTRRIVDNVPKSPSVRHKRITRQQEPRADKNRPHTASERLIKLLTSPAWLGRGGFSTAFLGDAEINQNGGNSTDLIPHS